MLDPQRCHTLLIFSKLKKSTEVLLQTIFLDIQRFRNRFDYQADLNSI
jgi:hypothetical protein